MNVAAAGHEGTVAQSGPARGGADPGDGAAQGAGGATERHHRLAAQAHTGGNRTFYNIDFLLKASLICVRKSCSLLFVIRYYSIVLWAVDVYLEGIQCHNKPDSIFKPSALLYAK